MSRCEAVDALYQDMAARHRARFRSIHVRRRRLMLASCRRPPLLTGIRRSSRSLRLRRPRTSAAPTSSSSSPRTSSSPFPTVSPRPLARRSSLPTALPPSSKRVAHRYLLRTAGWDGVNSDGGFFDRGKNNPLLLAKSPTANQKELFFASLLFTTTIMTSNFTVLFLPFLSSSQIPFPFPVPSYVTCCTLRTNPAMQLVGVARTICIQRKKFGTERW
jgi:hypothetical protein